MLLLLLTLSILVILVVVIADIAEVPNSMVKFPGQGQALRIISFSVIRPIGLNVDLILRLVARDARMHGLIMAHHQQHLRRLGGPITLRRAHRLLKLGRREQSDADGAASTCLSYFDTFQSMLLAGFDATQQPLLTVLRKQRVRAFKQSQVTVHAPGCWNCRGSREKTTMVIMAIPTMTIMTITLNND